MVEIDMQTWKRKEHFAFFHGMDYPQYNICADLDVTHFLAFTKEHGIPFYYAMIFAVTYAANQVAEFKYRLRNGKVILHDSLHPSFTYLAEGQEDLFKMVLAEMTEDIVTFACAAAEKARSQQAYFPQELAGRDDLLYLTCIPWISFTHLSHTITLDRDDAAPRISWGKYFSAGEKVLLPFSVQVNHAFVDGAHVGRYVKVLQDYMDTL